MKKIFKNKDNLGFSTLFVVIVLGAVSLAFVLSISTGSVWSIKNSTDSKDANKAKGLVNACAEVALEILRENNGYIGSDSVTISSSTCTYTISNTGGTTRNIVVSGTANQITRKLNINTNSFNPLVISLWQEVP